MSYLRQSRRKIKPRGTYAHFTHTCYPSSCNVSDCRHRMPPVMPKMSRSAISFPFQVHLRHLVNRARRHVKWPLKRSTQPAVSSRSVEPNWNWFLPIPNPNRKKVSPKQNVLSTPRKFNVLTGCWNSAVTYPTTAVAERYGIPFVVPVSVSDKITEQGFKTVFRIAAKDSWWTRDQFSFLKDMEKEFGTKVEKHGLCLRER